MLRQVVARNWLPSILVYSLQNLVSGSIAQAGEKRNEFAANWCCSLIFEDDLVELGGIGNLWRDGY